MKTHIREEFVRIDRQFEAGRLDFYGACSPLDAAAQKEFLAAYDAYATRRYGETAIFEKAVTEAEAMEMAARIGVGHSPLVFEAYSRPRHTLWRGWHLYTHRARLNTETATLFLDDQYAFPVPSAVFAYPKPLSRLSLSVCIGRGFLRDLPEGINPTTTGRSIELRQGHTEVIKLMFAPDGTFCYKDGTVRPYHYEVHKLDTFLPDAWNHLELVFFDKTFDLTFGGVTHTFRYQTDAVPDTLFFGGGMQPTDEWQVRIEEMTDTDGRIIPLFTPAMHDPRPTTPLGSVTLPCALGTHLHRDEELVLTTTFDWNGAGRVNLACESLDPGGTVFVNDTPVSYRDNFMGFTLDVTKATIVGSNTLTLIVDPRAPEVLYPWHRHKDPYHAWYASRVDVFIEECHIPTSPALFTTAVTDRTAEVTLHWDLSSLAPGRADGYSVTLAPAYPTPGEPYPVTSGVLAGDLDLPLSLSVTPWTPECPVLYDVTVSLYVGGRPLTAQTVQTGFRTIEQEKGAFCLNGRRILLKGALSMQFLPPYDRIPVNHVCPTDAEIVRQALEVKRMNGNCLRMHQLGYGTNENRFAEICDKLGVLLIWTTRLIDAAENMMWTEDWRQRADYSAQMQSVINHPSIIMWEGSNELHTDLAHIDRVYDTFVDTVRSVDPTRLICPVSHLYYGGGIYECGCRYYNHDGTLDESGNPATASYGWTDPRVVRSAHTYCLLLGYGTSWQNMATQNWKWQGEMLEDPHRAYMVSEYAVIGRQNPETPEARAFINKDSYEFGDEQAALHFTFADDEWRLSQAFQALCAGVATARLHRFGADGMLWCCLSSGANNASYLKPPLDFYGYKKWAYYALTETFADVLAFNAEPDVLLPQAYTLTPTLCGLPAGKTYTLTVDLLDTDRNTIFSTTQSVRSGDRYATLGSPIVLPETADGYYAIRYTVQTEN